MSKKKRQFNPELEKNEGINAVRNQLIESLKWTPLSRQLFLKNKVH